MSKARKNGRSDIAGGEMHVCPPDHYRRSSVSRPDSTCELSALQLRDAYVKDHGGESPLFGSPALRWSPAEISTCLANALELFQLQTGPTAPRLGPARDGGRIAMISALEAALIFLTQNLPVRDLSGLAPLSRLLQILKDLHDGITDQALKTARSGGNKHSRAAIDLKARCLLASDVLQARGLKKKVADQIVIDRVTPSAQLVKLINGRKAASRQAPIENWRRDWRRDAHSHPWQRQWPDGSLTLRIIQLEQELKVHLRLAASIQDLLDAILGPISVAA